MWITYNVLLYAGQELPKIYNWMLKSEFFAKLKYQILQTDHMRLQPLAVNLMYEMCRVQSLKPCDLGKSSRPSTYFYLGHLGGPYMFLRPIFMLHPVNFGEDI